MLWPLSSLFFFYQVEGVLPADDSADGDVDDGIVLRQSGTKRKFKQITADTSRKRICDGVAGVKQPIPGAEAVPEEEQENQEKESDPKDDVGMVIFFFLLFFCFFLLRLISERTFCTILPFF